jgi:hypothetical protein
MGMSLNLLKSQCKFSLVTELFQFNKRQTIFKLYKLNNLSFSSKDKLELKKTLINLVILI